MVWDCRLDPLYNSSSNYCPALHSYYNQVSNSPVANCCLQLPAGFCWVDLKPTASSSSIELAECPGIDVQLHLRSCPSCAAFTCCDLSSASHGPSAGMEWFTQYTSPIGDQLSEEGVLSENLLAKSSARRSKLLGQFAANAIQKSMFGATQVVKMAEPLPPLCIKAGPWAHSRSATHQPIAYPLVSGNPIPLRCSG